MTDLLRSEIERLSKTELHLHLDCSLSFDAVSQMVSNITYEAYDHDFIAPPKCSDLADFLRCTVRAIDLLQTEAHLRIAVRDLFQQLQADKVIYAEIRFAPLLHITHGLSAEQVVEIVADEVNATAKSSGIMCGIILCTLRHFSEAQSMQTAQLVKKHLPNTLICGFDIAADEAGFPIDAHIPAFRYAIKNDLPCTAHAGEARGPQSIRETLNMFEPARIGHGVRAIEDIQLLDELAEKQIHLEVCPTCNIQTDIYSQFIDHPIDRLFNYGISVGINTDARALVNVSLNDEYEKLARVFEWTTGHFLKCNQQAIEHSFAESSIKSQIMAKLNADYTLRSNI